MGPATIFPTEVRRKVPDEVQISPIYQRNDTPGDPGAKVPPFGTIFAGDARPLGGPGDPGGSIGAHGAHGCHGALWAPAALWGCAKRNLRLFGYAVTNFLRSAAIAASKGTEDP